MPITLKAARVNAGLTQKEAAEKLGIGKQTLANYENYVTSPRMPLGKKIAELYGADYNEIIFSCDESVLKAQDEK